MKNKSKTQKWSKDEDIIWSDRSQITNSSAYDEYVDQKDLFLDNKRLSPEANRKLKTLHTRKIRIKNDYFYDKQNTWKGIVALIFLIIICIMLLMSYAS